MNILILGDGLLGSELQKQTGWDIESRKTTNLDIDNYTELEKIISGYDCVVNCIAHTDSYSTEKNKHWNINYKFVVKLSDICMKLSIKLVHISTEFVYANNPVPPTEEEIPQPDVNWYAYTKLLADEYIKVSNSNYLICRESHKPNPFPYSEVWDIKTCGDTVDKIADLIIKLINKKAQGVFNVGTGMKALYKIAPNSQIIIPPSHVPKDTRMNLEKLNKFL